MNIIERCHPPPPVHSNLYVPGTSAAHKVRGGWWVWHVRGDLFWDTPGRVFRPEQASVVCGVAEGWLDLNQWRGKIECPEGSQDTRFAWDRLPAGPQRWFKRRGGRYCRCWGVGGGSRVAV